MLERSDDLALCGRAIGHARVQLVVARRRRPTRQEVEARIVDHDGVMAPQRDVDRLVIGHGLAGVDWVDVVDFKTDALSPGDARAMSRRVEHYRPQVEAYEMGLVNKVVPAADLADRMPKGAIHA